jgi:hypothetical protein
MSCPRSGAFLLINIHLIHENLIYLSILLDLEPLFDEHGLHSYSSISCISKQLDI